MLARQGSQVGIGHQVADSVAGFKHLLQQGLVLVCWLNQSYTRLVEPALDAITCFLKCQRPLV